MASPFPLPKFNFKVKFTPGGEIEFQEVTGLEIENEYNEYREGNDPDFIPTRRASIRKGGTVTFKKGHIKGDKALYDIYKEILDKKNHFSADGGPDLEISVELLDEKGGTSFTWKIAKAIPVKFSSDGYNATDNSIAVEQLEVVHSGITLQ